MERSAEGSLRARRRAYERRACWGGSRLAQFLRGLRMALARRGGGAAPTANPGRDAPGGFSGVREPRRPLPTMPTLGQARALDEDTRSPDLGTRLVGVSSRSRSLRTKPKGGRKTIPDRTPARARQGRRSRRRGGKLRHDARPTTAGGAVRIAVLRRGRCHCRASPHRLPPGPAHPGHRHRQLLVRHRRRAPLVLADAPADRASRRGHLHGRAPGRNGPPRPGCRPPSAARTLPSRPDHGRAPSSRLRLRHLAGSSGERGRAVRRGPRRVRPGALHDHGLLASRHLVVTPGRPGQPSRPGRDHGPLRRRAGRPHTPGERSSVGRPPSP